MSKSRGYLTRPRTKVYDCNYDIGQQYYKSTLDSLDRKYGNKTVSESTTNGALSSLTASLEREKKELTPLLTRPPPSRDIDDEEFFAESPRTPRSNALLGEFDSIFEGRGRLNIRAEKSNRALKTFDEEVDEDLSAAVKKLRATRAAAREESQLEVRKPRLELTDGLSKSADESRIVSRRKVVKITTSAAAESNGDDAYTRWTAINSEDRRRHALDEEPDTAAQIAAQARARKSRARLDDLEVEIQELSDRNAAREKRVRDLKNFMKENDVDSSDSVQQTVKVRSTTKSEKKMISY